MKDTPLEAPASQLDGMTIRIRQARERKGKSLSDLHKATGISRTALHDYESGRTKPGAKETKLLCETLEVTPNWLIFGNEEPFKKRDGLRALVKLKDSPLMVMVSMLILPTLISTFDDDQLEALLTIMATMLEARNRPAYNYVTAAAEVFTELIGDGSPDDLKRVSALASDPETLAALQSKIKDIADKLG